MAICISIANQKGGVGKTSTTRELAASLAEKKKKVLIIDFDQQSNLSSNVAADKSFHNIYEILQADATIEESIQTVGAYDIIIASEQLSTADKNFADTDDVYLLSDVIETISDQYDFILIDNGPSRNVLLTMSYIASDYIIIPTECDEDSLDGVSAINNDVRKLRDGKRQYSHAKVLGLILTKYEKTVMHALAEESLPEIASAMEEESGLKPFILKVRKSIVASEAKRMKMSLQEYAHSSTVAEDYRKIAAEIIKRTKGDK